MDAPDGPWQARLEALPCAQLAKPHFRRSQIPPILSSAFRPEIFYARVWFLS